MALDTVGGNLSNAQAEIAGFLTPRLVKEMKHGETGYFNRGDYGADTRDRKRNFKSLWLEGISPLYSEDEVRNQSGIADLPSFARVIRVNGGKVDGSEKVDGFIVDDSAQHHSETTPPEERIHLIDWSAEVSRRLKVIGWVGDVLSRDRMEEILAVQFEIVTGPNVLFSLSPQE